MMVETRGATTTKAMQEKIHHLKRFWLSAGGVFVLGSDMESEVGTIKFGKRGRLVKH